MAEVLIRVHDKINADFYANCQCTKRGDVIVAAPDGWPWGTQELTRPEYRVIRFTVLVISEAIAFTAPEVDTDPAHPSRTLQKRAFRLDIDNAAIPAGFAAWLADDTRAQPIRDAGLTLAQIRALRMQKPPIADPAIIGASAPAVIG